MSSTRPYWSLYSTLLEVIILRVDKPNVETTRFRFIQKRNRVVSTFGLSTLKNNDFNNVEITTPVSRRPRGHSHITGVVILMLMETLFKS